MKLERFVAFVTKYALTNGIEEIEVEDRGDGLVMTTEIFKRYIHKYDWHHNRADAIAKAEAMRARRVASVERQLAKLKAMKFE